MACKIPQSNQQERPPRGRPLPQPSRLRISATGDLKSAQDVLYEKATALKLSKGSQSEHAEGPGLVAMRDTSTNGRYFYGTNDLHIGLWRSDLPCSNHPCRHPHSRQGLTEVRPRPGDGAIPGSRGSPAVRGGSRMPRHQKKDTHPVISAGCASDSIRRSYYVASHWLPR
jgi:hypothetical protein